MSEVLMIDEGLRIRVEHDDAAPNPRIAIEGWATGFVNIPGRGDSRIMDVPAVHQDEAGIAIAYDEFHARAVKLGYENWNGASGMWRIGFDVAERVERWARVFHGLRLVYDSEHGGFWWVRMTEDWSTDWTGQLEQIQAERRAYEAWADGAVYSVILERAVVWKRMTGMLSEIGQRMITWEQEEALGGCYLTDAYTAWHVVSEHWPDSLDSEQEEIVESHLPAASPLAGDAVIP